MSDVTSLLYTKNILYTYSILYDRVVLGGTGDKRTKFGMTR